MRKYINIISAVAVLSLICAGTAWSQNRKVNAIRGSSTDTGIYSIILKARINVSGSDAEDYAEFGMARKSTDWYDNNYDALSVPKRLAPDQDNYIRTYFEHPEWGHANSKYRGDFRKIKEGDEWTLVVEAKLPEGTVLTMTAPEGTRVIPPDREVKVKDMDSGRTMDIKDLPYEFKMTPGSTRKVFKITVSVIHRTSFTISGRVFGLEREPLPDIQLSLKGPGDALYAKTDADGNYVFENVKPGTYRVTAYVAEIRYKKVNVSISYGDIRINFYPVQLSGSKPKVDIRRRRKLLRKKAVDVPAASNTKASGSDADEGAQGMGAAGLSASPDVNKQNTDEPDSSHAPDGSEDSVSPPAK